MRMRENRAWVDAALRKLRERDREAVVLRFMRGLPLAEVGAELGISEEAARKRVDRAVEKLRGLAPAPAEVQAMGIGVVISGMGMRAPEGMLAKVMSQVGGSAGAAGGTAATWRGLGGGGVCDGEGEDCGGGADCGDWGRCGGGGVAAGWWHGCDAGGNGNCGRRRTRSQATATRNDLALACWGAIVSEDVAGAVWRQMGGVGGGFRAAERFCAIRIGGGGWSGGRGGWVGRGGRGVLRQAMEDGEEIAWAIWAPAVNRIAGADGKFSFKGPKRDGQVQVIVEGPAGSYQQSGDSLMVERAG